MFSQSMVLPYTGILISLAGYLLGMWLFKISHGFFLFTPLLVGMVFGIAVLAIWAKGIGSCWLSAPQRMGFGPAFQRRFAPDKGEFVAAVTLGYPDQQPKMPPRRDGRYLIV